MPKARQDRGASPAQVKSKPPDSTSPITDFWLTLFQAADAQGKTVLDWSTPFWDPRLLQKKWFEAMSQAMDGYMRSTAFLEFMRQCTTTGAPGGSNGNAGVPREEKVEGDSHR